MWTRAEVVRSAVTESGVGKSGLHEKPDLPEAVHDGISEKGYLPPHTRNMHPKLWNVYFTSLSVLQKVYYVNQVIAVLVSDFREN